jgi:hypothetical protein
MHDNLPLVCFIVCDSRPATHFAAFAKSLLVGSNLRINIYASGSALEKFQTLNLSDDICLFQFILNELNNEEEEEELAIKLIDSCLMEGAQTIIVDIGNKFDIKLQEAYNKLDLALHNIHFWCYYDNPEEYVPGGYSIRSEEMIKLSKNILFANINLVKRDSKIFSLPNIMINCNNKNIQGIGYYPTDIAENLQKRREIERKTLRAKYGWNNIKYLFVYFGGNNKIYYNQAFPAFLSFLSQIDNNILEDIVSYSSTSRYIRLVHVTLGSECHTVTWTSRIFVKCILCDLFSVGRFIQSLSITKGLARDPIKVSQK